MAKQTSKTAEVSKAYGEELSSPIKFDYSYEELEKGDTIPPKEMPDDEGLISYVNQKRNAAARSAAQTKALKAAGIEAPTLEDAAFRFKQMVNILVAAGNTQEQAEQMAHTALGV